MEQPPQIIRQLLPADPSEDGGVGNLVTVEMKYRKHRPVLAGLRNFFDCQDAATGPVSASPSPITQQAIRSGLSNTAP